MPSASHEYIRFMAFALAAVLAAAILIHLVGQTIVTPHLRQGTPVHHKHIQPPTKRQPLHQRPTGQRKGFFCAIILRSSHLSILRHSTTTSCKPTTKKGVTTMRYNPLYGKRQNRNRFLRQHARPALVYDEYGTVLTPAEHDDDVRRRREGTKTN